MSITTIDGLTLKEMFLSGAALLDKLKALAAGSGLFVWRAPQEDV